MSIATNANSPDPRSAEATGDTSSPKIRVWPALVMVALFWACLIVNTDWTLLSLTPGQRFVSRMIAYLVMLVGFLVWWLSRRAIKWRDRLLAIVVAAVACVAVSFITDKSIDGFGLFLAAFPWIVTAWTLWVAVARSFSPTVKRIGFCAAMLLACSYFALVRFDGLEAAQQAEMNWRWAPTKEQTYLASRERERTDAPTSQAKPWQLQPGDCPEYRGRDRDGILRDVRIVADWNAKPPKMLWKRRVGPGWSGMIVVDGHVVTQEQRDQDEAVVCYNATSGDEEWAHDDAVRFEEALAGAGPRGTPTFVDGRIYSLGAKGTLNCLKAETGEVIWSHGIVADAEVTLVDRPQWGYSISPLVVDGLVVVYAGGKQKSVLAYRADDGKLAWTAAAGAQSYSSPQLATLHGERQILIDDNSGLTSLAIKDGNVLWQYPAQSAMAMPMLQPHQTAAGEVVVATDSGAALLSIAKDGDKWSAAPAWTSNKFRPGFNDFVIHEGHLYGLDDGILCCFDLATGERLWKKGRFGHGQLLMLADQDAVLCSSDKGDIILANVSPKGYEELGRFQAIEGKTWNSPVLVGNRLFLRNGEEMAAFEVNVEPAARSATGAK